MANKSCQSLGSLLKKNSYLQELYLHWNQIGPEGGELLMEALSGNDSVCVLDLSWNSLGESRLKSCTD